MYISKIIGLVKSRKDLPNWSVGFTCCSIFWLRLLIPDIFAVMAVDFRRQSKSSDDFHLTTRDSDDPMKRHLANIREWQLFWDLRWKSTFRMRMKAAKQKPMGHQNNWRRIYEFSTPGVSLYGIWVWYIFCSLW